MANDCKAKWHGLTQDRLRQVLAYDPDTGLFTWLVTLNARGPKGRIAGSVHPDGYRRINIDGKGYPAHWLAYFYTNNEWPEEHLDHINGERSDNRIVNLRPCTRRQNQQNKILPKNKYAPGVMRFQNGKFGVNIQNSAGVRIYLGRFNTPEEASAAYMEAKRLHHPFDVRNFR